MNRLSPLRWRESHPRPPTRALGSVWDLVKATVGHLARGAEEGVRPVPRSGDRIASWPLAADAASVPRARRLTRARLAAWELEGFSDIAELLVSELITNALQHAPGPCRLTIFAMDGLLRCEVEDSGTVLPQPYAARAYDEAGRGLCLLDMLACCWGSAHTPAGKALWFELPTRALSDD